MFSAEVLLHAAAQMLATDVDQCHGQTQVELITPLGKQTIMTIMWECQVSPLCEPRRGVSELRLVPLRLPPSPLNLFLSTMFASTPQGPQDCSLLSRICIIAQVPRIGQASILLRLHAGVGACGHLCEFLPHHWPLKHSLLIS